MPATSSRTSSSADRRFLRRALELAAMGTGLTFPNPRVGAVLVRGGKIIGEGFHKRAGTPHAEVHAVRAAKRAGHQSRARRFTSRSSRAQPTAARRPARG